MNNMPLLNDKDAKRLANSLARGELIPVLNNTKWAELIGEMRNGKEMKPQFRTRSVFAPSGFVTDWDGEWYHHIHPVAELEWVEIRAASPDWLLEVLRKHGIPFSDEGGFIRVWGYTRPGVQPFWK